MTPTSSKKESNLSLPKLPEWPIHGKALITMVIIMMSLGMLGAGGQIVVHDIIPTFWEDQKKHMTPDQQKAAVPAEDRGDLFAEDEMAPLPDVPFYESDEFIFALKFTHIHIFGMSAIFILMGAIALFLDLGSKIRTWLIILPFIGIIIDLASFSLKG